MQTFPPPVAFVEMPDFPNYEKIVASATYPVLIANDIDTTTREGQNKLNSLLYTRYQGDVMKAVPKCSCGEMSGPFNKGLICPNCNTQCLDVLDKPLESNLWVRTPDGIDKFITPGFWAVASRYLSKTQWNMLEWFINPTYPDPDPKKQKDYAKIIEGFNLEKQQRNLNFFHENFAIIMRLYVTLMLLRKKPRNIEGMSDEDIARAFHDLREGNVEGTWLLINTPLGDKNSDDKKLALFIEKYIANKERVFSKYLPMPSALGVVLETNNSGTWVDVSMATASDAMYAVKQIGISIANSDKKIKLGVSNRRAVLCTKKMAEFGKAFISGTAGSKQGEYRRHVFGGRLAFSMRAVITSINETHAHDELHIPWAPAVAMFKIHIMNKLMRKGFSPKLAHKFIDDHTNNYHPLLDQIFKELIAEAGGGIPCTFQRPPSLEKSSMQRCRITKVKTDARIRTISMSVNITNGPNADFDGDALHIWLILDKDMDKRFIRLAPSRSVLSMDNPRSVSGVFTQQAPQTLTMASWLKGGKSKHKRKQAA